MLDSLPSLTPMRLLMSLSPIPALELVHGQQRLVLACDDDADPAALMATIAASVASVGLEAVRTALAEGEPVDPHTLADDDQAQATQQVAALLGLDRYTLAAQARGWVPWGLERAVMADAHRAMQVETVGVAGVFAPVWLQAATLDATADTPCLFRLDLATGRVGWWRAGATRAEAHYLEFDLAGVQDHDPLAVHTVVAAGMAMVLHGLPTGPAAPEQEARALARLTHLLQHPGAWTIPDAPSAGPKPAWDHVCTLTGAMQAGGRVAEAAELSGRPPAFVAMDVMATADHVLGLNILHGLLQVLGTHIPVLAGLRGHLLELDFDERVLRLSGLAESAPMRALEQHVMLGLAEALVRTPELGLMLQTYHQAPISTPEGEPMPGRKALLAFAQSSEDPMLGVLALACLDSPLWGALPKAVRRAALKHGGLLPLLQTTLPALHRTLPGSTQALFSKFNADTRHELKLRGGPALAGVFFNR